MTYFSFKNYLEARVHTESLQWTLVNHLKLFEFFFNLGGVMYFPVLWYLIKKLLNVKKCKIFIPLSPGFWQDGSDAQGDKCIWLCLFWFKLHLFVISSIPHKLPFPWTASKVEKFFHVLNANHIKNIWGTCDVCIYK